MLAALLCNLSQPAPTPTVVIGPGIVRPVRSVRSYDKERARITVRQKQEDDEIFSVVMALIELDII